MPTRKKTRRTEGLRTGGRSARVVEAAYEATLAELGRVGYSALRIDDVAALSGVNKTTLYRRWPTKLELVAAAIREQSVDEPIPDTGDLRADLIRMIEDSLVRYLTPSRIGLIRIFYAEQSNPEVEALGRELREEHRQPRIARVARARERGEIAASVDPELVIEVLLGSIYGRIVRAGLSVDRAHVERLVDLVLDGARRGSAPRA